MSESLAARSDHTPAMMENHIMSDALGPVELPQVARDILVNLSDQQSREILEQILLDNQQKTLQSRVDYLQVKSEASDVLEQLRKVELELADVRSAAALAMTNQDDVISILKLRYDEEVASLHSISQHQVAEFQARNQNTLDQERAKWAHERSFLIDRLNRYPSQLCHRDIQSTKQSSNMYRSCDEPQDRVIYDPDAPVDRRLAALKQHNSHVPRSSHCSTQTDSASSVSPVDSHYIRRYEDEISRLRRMLDETELHNDAASVSDATRSGVLRRSPSPTQNATTELPSGSSRDASSILEDNFAQPITEPTWIRLQSNQRTASQSPKVSCAMCSDYEQRVQSLQINVSEKDKILCELNKRLKSLTKQHEDELANRLDLEDELKTSTSKHTERIADLETDLGRIRTRIDGLLSNYRAHREHIEKTICQVSAQSQTIRSSMQQLQNHYDAYIGRRSRAAAELSDQPIDLPSDKTELELLALRLHEENIALRIAREHLDERLQSESQSHHEEQMAERQERANSEQSLQRELDEVNARLTALRDMQMDRDNEVVARMKAEKLVQELKTRLSDAQGKQSLAETAANEAQQEVVKLQQRFSCLQTDLDNAELVQADFVRLSQNLQMQLESLRQQEQEVRWVLPEDCTNCTTCQTPFPSGYSGNSKKINCRHCGKVHCPNCTKNTIPSGPMRRPAQVCNFCHTLLNKHAAPYFSSAFHDPSTGAQIRTDSPRSDLVPNSAQQSPSTSSINRHA